MRKIFMPVLLALFAGCEYGAQGVITVYRYLDGRIQATDTIITSYFTTDGKPTVVEDRVFESPDVAYTIAGTTPYHFSEDYYLTDSIYSLHYEVQIALLPDDPSWIKEFVNQSIQHKVGDSSLLEDQSPKLFDMRTSSSWDEICRYYYEWLKECYIKEFPQDIEDAKYLGADYNFVFTVYPVWENDRYITFQIFVDMCYGSMHNSETDFCRTYEKSSGRLLGIADFYTESEFDEVTVWLGSRLDSLLDRTGMTPELDPDKSPAKASSDMTLKENYKGKIYPRPALVEEGIIFTYQTYEHGAPRAYDTMKFIKPYNKEMR